MRDDHFTDEEVFSRTAVARLWWPGYLDLGAADYAAKVAEDGWHLYDLNEDGSYVQVGGDYLLAWDHSPAHIDGTEGAE